jgi:putative methyltransferase (TIGR04325 family)
MASSPAQARRPSLDDVRAALAHLANVAPILRWRKKRYERKFASTREWRGLQRGLYVSFAEARRHAPAVQAKDYVTDDEWYAKTANIETFDYPVIFWLSTLLPEIRTVFDLGGHVGVHFYGYRPYLTVPAALRWTVCEQPQVVDLARSLHPDHESHGLSFATDWASAEGSDVLLSAGCIQYLETPLATSLGEMRKPPQHLLLNKLPLYDRSTRVTLQNTGRSFTPCWMFERKALVADLERLGYRVVDEWSCPRRGLEIPFHADHTIKMFTGLYLKHERADR